MWERNERIGEEQGESKDEQGESKDEQGESKDEQGKRSLELRRPN
jgi:hypothetical protein